VDGTRVVSGAGDTYNDGAMNRGVRDQSAYERHEAGVTAAAAAVGQHRVLHSATLASVRAHIAASALGADPCWCCACAAYREERDDAEVERARQRMADALRPYL